MVESVIVSIKLITFVLEQAVGPKIIPQKAFVRENRRGLYRMIAKLQNETSTSAVSTVRTMCLVCDLRTRLRLQKRHRKAFSHASRRFPLKFFPLGGFGRGEPTGCSHNNDRNAAEESVCRFNRAHNVSTIFGLSKKNYFEKHSLCCAGGLYRDHSAGGVGRGEQAGRPYKDD
jgi:hypothetical protein